MVELMLDLPDWLWAALAVYFLAGAVLNGTRAYLTRLEIKQMREPYHD